MRAWSWKYRHLLHKSKLSLSSIMLKMFCERMKTNLESWSIISSLNYLAYQFLWHLVKKFQISVISLRNYMRCRPFPINSPSNSLKKKLFVKLNQKKSKSSSNSKMYKKIAVGLHFNLKWSLEVVISTLQIITYALFSVDIHFLLPWLLRSFRVIDLSLTCTKCFWVWLIQEISWQMCKV